MLKYAITCALGAALSFPGTLGFAQDASPPHQGVGPVHNWRKYQATQDDPNDLDLQDVTRKQAQEIDRIYNQLESTGGHPRLTDNGSQDGNELDETGLTKEIDQENRLLDRSLNICRGC